MVKWPDLKVKSWPIGVEFSLVIGEDSEQGFFSRRKNSDKTENHVFQWGPVIFVAGQNFRLF